MSLMKNTPLDMWQQFMACSSEVVKLPFNDRCDTRQAPCLLCVGTYVPRWDM